MSTPEFRAALTDAIGYWERRRVVYNMVLVVVTGAVFLSRQPQSAHAISFGLAEELFVLAVLANIAYCAAYPVDLIVQSSGYRANWLRVRWVLLALGLVFAAVITQFVAAGMFSGAP